MSDTTTTSSCCCSSKRTTTAADSHQEDLPIAKTATEQDDLSQ